MRRYLLVDQECQELFKNEEGLNERAKVLCNVLVMGEEPCRQVVLNVDFSESPIADDAEAIEAVTDEDQHQCVETILHSAAIMDQELPDQISMSFRISDKSEVEIISAEPRNTSEHEDGNRTITQVEVTIATEEGMRTFDAMVYMVGPFNPALIYYWIRSDEFRQRICTFGLSKQVTTDNEIGLLAPDSPTLYDRLMKDDSDDADFPKWLYERFMREGWGDFETSEEEG